MTLKFYMTPGSCSTGIHILLEELELLFEVSIVNLPAGGHLRPEYLAFNPKGTIPTLVPDGGQALGPDFTIADAALFYVQFWADKIGLPLPPRCAALRTTSGYARGRWCSACCARKVIAETCPPHAPSACGSARHAPRIRSPFLKGPIPCSSP